MKNYTQFKIEYVFWEPGKGWHVALSSNGQNYFSSIKPGLERVLTENRVQRDLTLVPADEVCLHLKKLMEGLKHHLKSNTIPEDTYMANFDALSKIVGIYEQCRETCEDNSSAITSAVN